MDINTYYDCSKAMAPDMTLDCHSGLGSTTAPDCCAGYSDQATVAVERSPPTQPQVLSRAWVFVLLLMVTEATNSNTVRHSKAMDPDSNLGCNPVWTSPGSQVAVLTTPFS